jgi:glycosyltransferase involved in cell wall biosynthesis
VLHQPHRGSPGATRNLGIINTTGEIVALVDSDVSLEPSWLRIGVTSLLERGADLVAGRIDLYYVFGGTAAEMFDALFHARNEVLVERHSRATTANLLVRRRVFNAVGLFPEITSGEDSIFTFRSVQQGFRLIYEPRLAVGHPTKRLDGLLAKARRVGDVYGDVVAAEGRTKGRALKTIFRSFLPRSFRGIRRAIKERGRPDMQNHVAGIWAVSLVYGYVWGIAALRSLLRAREESGPFRATASREAPGR